MTQGPGNPGSGRPGSGSSLLLRSVLRIPDYRIPVILLVAALLPPVRHQGPPPPTVRFHHLHFRSSDPAGSMADVIRAAGGTPTYVPGLGPGVRLDAVYVFFDRSGATGAGAPVPPAAALASAQQWLEARKIGVRASVPAERLLAAVALWMGWPQVVMFLIVTSLAGGALALAMKLWQAVRIAHEVHDIPWFKRAIRAPLDLPYGAAIAVGCVSAYPQTWWMQSLV